MPLAWAESKQLRLSHPQPVVGLPKQPTDTSTNSAGITTTKMTFTRLIFSWTQLVFERSIKSIQGFSITTPEHVNPCEERIPANGQVPITKQHGGYNQDLGRLQALV